MRELAPHVLGGELAVPNVATWENMSQLAGWRFLELGRRIERAIATCRFVEQFAETPVLDGAPSHVPAKWDPVRRQEHAPLNDARAGSVPEGTEPALEVLLELADSLITYRQRYVMVAARAPVVDLVMLDPNNPRSAAYQLDRIEAHLAALLRNA